MADKNLIIRYKKKLKSNILYHENKKEDICKDFEVHDSNTPNHTSILPFCFGSLTIKETVPTVIAGAVYILYR